MKRFASLFVVAVLMIALAIPGLAAGKTTVTFALWDENQKPVFDQSIAKFQTENPDIAVELQLTPWSQYWTKLDAAMGADKAADVFWMNTFLPKYVAAKVLEPLDAYIEKDGLDMSAYVGVVRDAYKINNVTYALPKGMDTVQVFFNKAIFEKYGVDLPMEGWTWDDMTVIAAKLKEKAADGEYPIVMELDPQPSYFNFIAQDGGFIISDDQKKAGFDQEGTVNSYKKVLKLMADGLMPDYKVLSDTKGTDLFLSQKAAILFMGSWKAMVLDDASFADKIGLIPMPKMDKNNVSVLGGLGFAMNAGAKDKDAAWKLIKFLAGEESNKMQAEGKIDMPALISAQQYYAPNFKYLDASVFFKVAETGYFFPTSQKVAEWLPAVMDVSSQILSGSISPEDGCKMIQEQMQPILDSEN